MTQIVVVEDDTALNRRIRQELASLGDRLFGFYKLSQAYKFLEKDTADLMIVDRQLVDGDGLELVEHLHETHFFTKVLILSRLKTVTERIKGLSLGADDYLTKPFHPAELKLRVKRLLAKEKKQLDQELVYGGLSFNPQTGQLTVFDYQTTLRKKETQVLKVLLQYKNQVITHAQIAQRAWPGEKFYPSHTTINVYIRRLRIKLGPYKNIIQTVRKFGYRLQTDVLTP